jgi:plasmid stabilization system protein ParE
MLTKQEIKHYIIRARGLNKQGILYPSVIKLAKELNVSEVLIYYDQEQKAIKKARKVFNWIEKHNGKYPINGSKNKVEQQHATWIQNQKTARQGKGNGYRYYKSVYKIFAKKYPRIFDTLEQEAVEKAREVFNWIKDHNGKYPVNSSKNKLEKQYATWIQNQKQAKKSKGNSKYYESVYNVFEKEYPRIFDTLEEQSIETAKEVLNWIDDHNGNYPKQKLKDTIENHYACWIQTQKKAKQGKGNWKYYESVYKIFEKKYPRIFDTIK